MVQPLLTVHDAGRRRVQSRLAACGYHGGGAIYSERGSVDGEVEGKGQGAFCGGGGGWVRV